MLTPDRLEEAENELQCSDVDYSALFNFGIRKSYDDKPIGTTNQLKKHYYFIHLSFQEPLATRHLLNTLIKPRPNSPSPHSQEHRF